MQCHLEEFAAGNINTETWMQQRRQNSRRNTDIISAPHDSKQKTITENRLSKRPIATPFYFWRLAPSNESVPRPFVHPHPPTTTNTGKAKRKAQPR
jgi:hypothetical protein